MKILTVVGARPNFMKAAPIITAIRKHNRETGTGTSSESPGIEHVLVHTGQHYDAMMSDSFFADLNLPAPDIRLGVGSATHAVQTAEVLAKFETVLLRERPDVVIVLGDVNSTVACALATAKISFDSTGTRPLLVHVESGLRSFDRAMPEEVNRVVTDHISDILFVTEESGSLNLLNEGVSPDKIHFVGNTMIDSLLAFRGKADLSTILERLNLAPAHANGAPQSIRPYALLTLHRPSNVDNPDTFRDILGGLEELAKGCPIIFPAHPRTHKRINDFGLGLNGGGEGGAESGRDVGRNGFIVVDPLGYLDFLCLMKNAAVVITDSGGIQEETTCLGIPCVTVRENTERPVTVEKGTNIIAGTARENIQVAVRKQMCKRKHHATPEKWDGEASARILQVLIGIIQERSRLTRLPVELRA